MHKSRTDPASADAGLIHDAYESNKDEFNACLCVQGTLPAVTLQALGFLVILPVHLVGAG